MTFHLLTEQSEIDDLCQTLRSSRRIGFDTEFVSEDTYRPVLCLIQINADGEIYLIDPMGEVDVAGFWSMLAEGSQTTIAHAAREESNFSLDAIGQCPANLFDTQIGAGLVGLEYPAAYSSLVYRFLDQRPNKGETRTDWRKRPLSSQQLEYAADDVRYLLDLHTEIELQLERHGRQDWMNEEMVKWQAGVKIARDAEKWHKLSGVGKLSGKGLKIARELWVWREAVAATKDIPAKRILRDDLIIEIAKRGSADPQRIRAIRGFGRAVSPRLVEDISSCVEAAADAPSVRIPNKKAKSLPDQLHLLGQFLTPAVTSLCRDEAIAASLVGGAGSVRDYIANRLGFSNGEEEPPSLAQGWRAELIGSRLDDLLAGNTSIRIVDPHSEHPLAFDACETE